MHFYIQIFSLFLLWVNESRGTPTTNQHPSQGSQHSVTRTSSGWSQNRNISAGGNGSRVVFPNHFSSSVSHEFTQTRFGQITPELSSSCKKSGRFCNATNYPKEYIDKLLEESGLVNQGVFKINEGEHKDKEEKDDDLGIRQGGSPKEFDLCPSVVDANVQNTGVDKDGKKRFIINQENVTQLIRQNKCETTGTPCKLDNFPINYIVKCRQKYIDRKFAALNDNNQIEWMLFPTPSCCVCSYYNKVSTRSIFTSPNQSNIND